PDGFSPVDRMVPHPPRLPHHPLPMFPGAAPERSVGTPRRGRPLPRLPRHIVESIRASPVRELADRGGPVIPAFRIQLFWIIGVSPGETSSIGAPGRFLPFLLRGKALPHRLAVLLR